jgi:hypothetical protein
MENILKNNIKTSISKFVWEYVGEYFATHSRDLLKAFTLFMKKRIPGDYVEIYKINTEIVEFNQTKFSISYFQYNGDNVLVWTGLNEFVVYPKQIYEDEECTFLKVNHL